MFVTVKQGEFEVRGDDDFEGNRFAPTREGLRGMAIYFAERNAPESVMCSSSCDFPEEDGMPEGFDAREFIGIAIALAKEDLIDEMESEDVAPHVARVVLEG